MFMEMFQIEFGSSKKPGHKMSFYLTLVLVLFSVLVYFFIKQKYSYWEQNGSIPGPRPIFPFGYLLERALTEPPDFENRMTQKYGRVYGLYSGLLPTLTVNDAELIKQILVKDFALFLNRRSLNSYHEMWNDNLFSAEGETWKRVRTISSRSFSSGKLRAMNPLMSLSVDKLTAYLDKVVQPNSIHNIDIKQVITGFTIDVIASTLFATETDANGDRSNAQNDRLLKNCMQIFSINGWRLAATFSLPRRVLNVLGVTSWLDPVAFDYFIALTKQIMTQRRLEGAKRSDFVQSLMDSYVFEDVLKDIEYDELIANDDSFDANTKTRGNNSKKQILTECQIIAQLIQFFAAGFETTASTICNALYELAKHPEVQDNLAFELSENLQNIKSDCSEYLEVVNKLTYLNAIVKETLRRYPAAVRLERRYGDHKQDYKLGDNINLKAGTLIEISCVAVHHDPEYYPDPYRFDPNRFMPQNASQLTPYTYIPFGAGPRNCIGLRFAYQEIKLCLAKLVQTYRFSVTEKTPDKLSFKPGSLLLNVLPFEIAIERRVA